MLGYPGPHPRPLWARLGLLSRGPLRGGGGFWRWGLNASFPAPRLFVWVDMCTCQRPPRQILGEVPPPLCSAPLPYPPPVHSRVLSLSPDCHALMLSLKLHTLNPHLRSMVVLHDPRNARFLPASVKRRQPPVAAAEGGLGRCWGRARARGTAVAAGAASPAAASGQSFTEGLLDRLLGRLFYNDWLLDVVDQFVGRPDFRSGPGDASAQVFLMPLPGLFLADCPTGERVYGRLVLHLLRTRRLLAVGLLRNGPTGAGGAPGPAAPPAYMALAPGPSTALHATDHVYVLGHEQPHPARHGASETAVQ